MDSNKEEGSWSSWWLWTCLALVVFLVLWFLIRPVEEAVAGYVESGLSTALAFVTTAVLLRVAHEFGYLKTRPGLVMMLIAVGFALWTLAEAIWFYYIVIDVDPFPSIADAFWIVGYVPMIVALFLNARAIPIKFSKGGLAGWIVLSFVVILTVLAFILLPLLAEDTSFETIVTAVYPVEDLLLIVPAFIVILKFRSGKVAVPWAFLTLGFLLTAVGDILYTYAESAGLYGTAYNATDLFLLLGYVACIFSGFEFVKLYRTQSVEH